MAIYCLYNKKTDLEVGVTASLDDALSQAKILIGTPVKHNIEVYVYNDINTREDYYTESPVVEADTIYKSLIDFIDEHKGPYEIETPAPKDKKSNDAWEVMNDLPNDTLHHLSEREQVEVLQWVPDELLIDEVMRRLVEYKTLTGSVMSAYDHLRIYV